MYSCSSFGIKVGGSIGAAVCGWLMAAACFGENTAVQTPDAVDMLHFMCLWLPMAFNVVVTIILSMLDVEKTNESLASVKD